MKIIAWFVGGLLGIAVLFMLVQTLASERVEVVELHTVDEVGAPVTTRLWVMDHEGYQYLRVGADVSGWFTRLQANKTVKLTRGDTTATYETLLRPDKSALINRLIQEKYTWGDNFFAAVFGGREGSIPIELQPLSP